MKDEASAKTTETIIVKDDEEDDVEWEDAESLPQVPAEQLDKVLTEPEKHVDSEQDTASSVEEDDNSSIENEDEMFLSLKNELEDAKGQEDLALLKEEALNSALATASNLTCVYYLLCIARVSGCLTKNILCS